MDGRTRPVEARSLQERLLGAGATGGGAGPAGENDTLHRCTTSSSTGNWPIVSAHATLRKSADLATLATSRFNSKGPPTAMTKPTTPLLVLAALVGVLSGCGGGGGKSAGGTTSSGGKGANGISVGNCLNDQDFLVQPNQTSVDGQSPAGVSFTLTFYKDAAAAKAVAAKKNPKTTALVESGVVDFRGNASPYEGAPPAKISKVELNAIKDCIDSTSKR